jgi:hypothetical protein
MECLTETKIQEYMDGSLNSVESAMVRDHIIVCRTCKKTHEEFGEMEKHLQNPEEIIPPAIIERNVLKTLFPVLPTYSSILGLIAASFLLLVTSIYIYFDFANNSLIQAIRLTSRDTSNLIGSLVEAISSIFSAVYAVFKALNRFLHIIFDINLGVEIIGLTVFALFSLVCYSIYKFAFKRLKN